MKVFDWNDILNVKSDFFEKGSALTIGSFDGPHKGHESLFVSVLNAATEKNLISGIITFKQALPGLKHPVNYAGDIATLQQRLFQYENKGFDFVVVIDFNESFSHISGRDFFEILYKKINLRYIAEGQDFRCGYKGLFGIQEITDFAFKNGFEAAFLKLVQTDGQRISSSSIRKLVQNGEFSVVNELLERSFELYVKTDVSQDSKLVKIDRKLLKQVAPFSGEYKVLLNGKVNAVLRAEQNFLEISDADFSELRIIEKICF